MDSVITQLARDHRAGAGAGLLRFLPALLAAGGSGLVLGAAALLAAELPGAHAFLYDRGWTQPLTLLLFFWGAGHLLRRALAQRQEHRALHACRAMVRNAPLDRERVPELLAATADLLPAAAPQVLQAVLSFFRGHRPTRDEVWRVAVDEIDRSAERIEAELRPAAACAWLIPLSGFLGTVLGMSRAIGSFHEVIRSDGGDMAALLPSVDGLAVAFDTTLFALALVVPLKVMELWVQRRDAALVADLDRTVGTGLVRDLDLAGLAQQSPEELALQDTAETLGSVRESLLRIDEALAAVGSRIQRAEEIWRTTVELREAARAVRQSLPELQQEVRRLREQGERPLTLVRGGPRAAPEEP